MRRGTEQDGKRARAVARKVNIATNHVAVTGLRFSIVPRLQRTSLAAANHERARSCQGRSIDWQGCQKIREVAIREGALWTQRAVIAAAFNWDSVRMRRNSGPRSWRITID